MNRYFIQIKESLEKKNMDKFNRFTLIAKDLNDLDLQLRNLGWNQHEIEILAWEKIEDIPNFYSGGGCISK